MRTLIPRMLLFGLFALTLIFTACGGSATTLVTTTTSPTTTTSLAPSTTTMPTTTTTATQTPAITTTTTTPMPTTTATQTTTTPISTTTTTTTTTPPVTTTTEEASPPKAGEWVASIEIGEIWFIVNDDGTGITEAGIRIPGRFSCGGGTATGAKISVGYPSGLLMTDKQFTASLTASIGWVIDIEGSFDVTGMQASGTWQIGSIVATCESGTWTSTRE